MSEQRPADASGTFTLGGDLVVNRLGYGAMQITGKGVWGDPRDPAEAQRVLKRALELGVNFIDTADAYGPFVSELLIKRALAPYRGSRWQRARSRGPVVRSRSLPSSTRPRLRNSLWHGSCAARR
jgi:hypothetical protein